MCSSDREIFEYNDGGCIYLLNRKSKEWIMLYYNVRSVLEETVFHLYWKYKVVANHYELVSDHVKLVANHDSWWSIMTAGHQSWQLVTNHDIWSPIMTAGHQSWQLVTNHDSWSPIMTSYWHHFFTCCYLNMIDTCSFK